MRSGRKVGKSNTRRRRRRILYILEDGVQKEDKEKS
jgi:hypothetical protein